ncbi:hypothetical protein BGX23_011295, partial [Mortierella sp. AD031]
MSSPKQEKQASESPRAPSIASAHSDSTRSKTSSASAKKWFRSSVKVEDSSILKGLASVQHTALDMFVPKNYQDSAAPISIESGVENMSIMAPISPQSPTISPSPSAISITAITLETKNKDPSESPSGTLQPSTISVSAESQSNIKASPSAVQQPWLSIFPHNIAAPVFSAALTPSGTRIESTSELVYRGTLLREHLSPSLAAGSLKSPLGSSQQALVDTHLQDEEEKTRIRWLITRVVEEFAADSLKSSRTIAEVVLLGPALDREYHRKLLNCLIAEFENAKLLDLDLLQGLIEMVQSAPSDYILADDLVKVLRVLRTRLQDTHQQSPEHPYYLVLALSHLFDAMVEGKVQDLNRVVDQEPLSELLTDLSSNSDPYLKHQATYALQGLLHVPNDESRRQFVLRHGGNIAMGLLGVASVCKLDPIGFSDGVDHLYKVGGDAHEVATKMAEGAKLLRESGQGLWASMKGGVFSGGRQLWYTALREVQEHIRNGRLAKFNRDVFAASSGRNLEFQWGVCLALGEIAIDPRWDSTIRRQAIDFLGEFYRNDTLWNPDKEIIGWILSLVRQTSESSDATVADHARSLLRSLEKEGDDSKQTIYRNCMDGPVNPYPIKARLSAPTSSPLLTRVLAIPGVEYDLYQLKIRRLKEGAQPLYIPPQAKPTLQSSDDTLFPLMEKARKFLSTHRQVLLLLGDSGDSGAGKSTFNLQLDQTLWKTYKDGDSIPLLINLPTIDRPDQDLIGKYLRKHSFKEDQIRELKLSRRFIVICDGYDESQLKTNIYNSNELNQVDQWRVKVVVSCRSQYLGSDYRLFFQPQVGGAYNRTVNPVDLLEEAVIAPFNKDQVRQYVEQYAKSLPAHDPIRDKPLWTSDEYMEKLLNIPNLMDLVSNPFLLTLSLEALPAVVGSKQDLSSIRITRVGLYDAFVRQWLEVNKLKLAASPLNDSERSELLLLLEDDFVKHGVRFQKELAEAIFKEQAGQPVVQYTHLSDRGTWKASFFYPDGQVKLLRVASTVTRSGTYFRFIHKSLLEYFYSRTIYDSSNYGISSNYSTEAASPDRPSTTA